VYTSLSGAFSSGTPTATDWKVLQGKSILDLVKGDLDGLKRLNMSANDKKKIDAWAALLFQTEQKIVSAMCNAETAAAIGITADAVKSPPRDTATQFTTGGDLMINLITLSMMCDTNRVFILQWPGFVKFTCDGMNHQYDHHGLSHRNGSAAVNGTCVADVIASINQIDQWYAGRYTKLVNAINNVKEGDKTMLDNSMVMWLPELADGNAHNNNNLPIVIAGSAGGYLKQGQSINLDPKLTTLNTGNSEASCSNGATTVSFNTGSNTGNVPLNKLHVTLLNALGAKDPATGMPFTTFGVADSNKLEMGITNPGELTQLRA
jgi:hypothetical protein